MSLLFADAGLPTWLQELGPNGMNLVFTVGFMTVLVLGIIAIPIVAIALHHRRAILKHRERMAMIDAGMHPDFPAAGSEIPAEPESLKRTVEYRPTA